MRHLIVLLKLAVTAAVTLVIVAAMAQIGQVVAVQQDAALCEELAQDWERLAQMTPEEREFALPDIQAKEDQRARLREAITQLQQGNNGAGRHVVP